MEYKELLFHLYIIFFIGNISSVLLMFIFDSLINNIRGILKGDFKE